MLGLHEDCKKRLCEVIAKGLNSVTVNHGMFIEYKSTISLALADSVVPQTGPVRAKLEKYLGQLPAFNFVTETLGRELAENGTYDDDSKGVPLQSLAGYEDLAEVASRLVSELDTLPWPFAFTLKLPPRVGEKIRAATTRFDLSSSMCIISPDEAYGAKFPLTSGIPGRDRGLAGFGSNLLGLRTTREWDTNTAYIRVFSEGFIGKYGMGVSAEDAVSTFKGMLGICIALRMIKVGSDARGLGALGIGMPSKHHLIIHRRTDSGWQIWSTLELPTSLSSLIDRLEIDDMNGTIPFEKISGFILHRLNSISTAYKSPSKAERVVLAAEWLLDSYHDENELLSFVQATVAMEIMLGEEQKSDIIGIGELIRNRCAYLIGKSHSQRQEVLKDFNDIYQVRSKIVHRGKSKLNNVERNLFQKLRWMVSRVIWEELELIQKDEDRKVS